jgi:hypothetical protein
MLLARLGLPRSNGLVLTEQLNSNRNFPKRQNRRERATRKGSRIEPLTNGTRYNIVFLSFEHCDITWLARLVQAEKTRNVSG